ncbi:ferritin-like domain-containing protein [Cohnella silvisoli]|uniref:Ferritin-like domain-containing protein n=1 Tax=Cohnella silvisoli TaxID=2873699 RepID=A0ABV1L164_9BACL|nr:ferritin-like domain-containing protein [Cohnella silvisoli]MCD9025224.1 ferritin-like domain-containing protein [Cohnella silvisoli]
MYWGYRYHLRLQPVWATETNKALELIKESVQGERNDELFYDELIRLSPTSEQTAIIETIRDDEREHNRMFQDIYQELTGYPVTGISNEQFIKPKSYVQGLQTALMGELAAVEKYRRIWFGLPAGIYKDTVFGIILDELKHASKYNYLLGIERK